MDPDELRDQLGSHLAVVRDAAGMNQRQLAEALGTSQATVSRWESGDNYVSLHDYLRIASALNVPVARLLSPILGADGVAVETDVAAMLRTLASRLESGDEIE